MKKPKIMECQISQVYQSPEINFKHLYTYCTVLYKSGVIRKYNIMPFTVLKWVDNARRQNISEIFDACKMTITYNVTYIRSDKP